MADKINNDWLLSGDFSKLTLNEELPDKTSSNNTPSTSSQAMGYIFESIVNLCGTRSAGMLACTCHKLFQMTFQSFAKNRESLSDISSTILSKCDLRYLHTFLKTCSDEGMQKETEVDLELQYPFWSSGLPQDFPKALVDMQQFVKINAVAFRLYWNETEVSNCLACFDSLKQITFLDCPALLDIHSVLECYKGSRAFFGFKRYAGHHTIVTLQSNPEDPAYYVFLGKKLSQSEGDLQQALTYWKKASTLYKMKQDYERLLLVAKSLQGYDDQECRALLDYVAKSCVTPKMSEHSRTQYFTEGEGQENRQLLSSICSIDPTYSLAKLMLGELPLQDDLAGLTLVALRTRNSEQLMPIRGKVLPVFAEDVEKALDTLMGSLYDCKSWITLLVALSASNYDITPFLDALICTTINQGEFDTVSFYHFLFENAFHQERKLFLRVVTDTMSEAMHTFLHQLLSKRPSLTEVQEIIELIKQEQSYEQIFLRYDLLKSLHAFPHAEKELAEVLIDHKYIPHITGTALVDLIRTYVYEKNYRRAKKLLDRALSIMIPEGDVNHLRMLQTIIRDYKLFSEEHHVISQYFSVLQQFAFHKKFS